MCLPFPIEISTSEPELLLLHLFLFKQNVPVHFVLIFLVPFQTALEIFNVELALNNVFPLRRRLKSKDLRIFFGKCDTFSFGLILF